LIVLNDVDLVHVGRDFADKLDSLILIIIELNVFDASFRCSNDALVVLVIHAAGRDWVFRLDSRDHVGIIGGHHFGRLVSISDQVALSATDNHLRVLVDDATDGFSQDEFFLSVL